MSDKQCKDCKRTCLSCAFMGYKKSRYRTWWLEQHDVAFCTKGHEIRICKSNSVNCRNDWRPIPRWFTRLTFWRRTMKALVIITLTAIAIYIILGLTTGVWDWG